MNKKKVYCWHCMWYIPPSMGSLNEFSVFHVPDKCVNIIAFSSKKVKETYKKPGYDQPIVIPPSELNKNNNCKGFTEGIHHSRIQKEDPPKSWWRFWK